jgi:hypothetical protein
MRERLYEAAGPQRGSAEMADEAGEVYGAKREKLDQIARREREKEEARDRPGWRMRIRKYAAWRAVWLVAASASATGAVEELESGG